MAAGRENFIFFLCPLDGVRFTYGTIAAQTALARTLATLVFQLGRLLGLG